MLQLLICQCMNSNNVTQNVLIYFPFPFFTTSGFSTNYHFYTNVGTKRGMQSLPKSPLPAKLFNNHATLITFYDIVSLKYTSIVSPIYKYHQNETIYLFIILNYFKHFNRWHQLLVLLKKTKYILKTMRISGHYVPFFLAPAVGREPFGPPHGGLWPLLKGEWPPSHPDTLISTIGLPIVKILSIKKVFFPPKQVILDLFFKLIFENKMSLN